MRRMLLILSLAGVAACSNPFAEREAAKAREAMLPVISGIVVEEMPGVPVQRTAECIADNANEEETFRLVEAALQGTSGDDVQMVLRIARRPETQACLAAAGISV